MTNKAYITKRDKLIRTAELYANKHHPDGSENNYNSDWTKTFILKMDRLAVESGIHDTFLHRQNRTTKGSDI